MNPLHQINDDFTGNEETTTKFDEDDDEYDHIDKKITDLRLSRESFDPDEEITRVLTTENPHGPKNLVTFSNRDRQFVQLANMEQLIVHHSYEGNLIPVDSDDAKIYLQREKFHRKQILPTALRDFHMKDQQNIERKNVDEIVQCIQNESNDDDEQRKITNDSNELTDESTLNSKSQDMPLITKPKKTLNRFNFCEQGIQTYVSPKKDVTTITDTIQHKKFVGLANQRIIYQEYVIDYEKQQKDKNKRIEKTNYVSTKTTLEKKNFKIDRLKPEVIVKRRQAQILKIIERILNQNRYHELIYNFKYFEDKMDEIRDPMGTLFQLWKFQPSSANRSVTALTWNPAYSDMLIIGYGLYDLTERAQGTIALFTLNNSYPNTLIHTESTVLSIDCLSSRPYLICVGLMDGDVIVYDVSVPCGRVVFMNSSYECKHLGSVWQVRWCTPSKNNYLQFCSAGADGKVIRWTCIKGELRQVLLLDLPSATKPIRLDDGTLLSMPGPAIALDFHRKRKDVFLVGTEDGKIYKSSINDPGIIDMTYNAHNFAVYSIQWSPFHPNIFASCSADGTIKVWHEKIPEYLMRFDLCTSLYDLGWSPITSTMFAVVGANGKIYVFDIHANKLEPICEQLVSNETDKMCTKIAFNPIHPILLAGDETGWTTCLKLSPNLRKKAKIPKGIEFPSNYDPEFDKLAQELARTVNEDSINDILIKQTIDDED